MKNSLRKEQLALLKFEKQLIGLGAGLGALFAAAGPSAKTIIGVVPADENAKVQEAYLNLVEAVQSAHNAMEQSAISAGAELLKATGVPKTQSLTEIAKSVLGIG